MITQPRLRVFSAAFALLMVGAAAFHAHGPALVAVALGVISVLAGVIFRAAATLAVLLAVSAMVLSDATPSLAAVSGLSAAGYLVLRYAADAPGLAALTQATAVGALGFTLAGLAATVFPLRLPWLPLLAPIAIFTIYAVATRPFWTKPSTGDERM
jgi:hypothetical protein